MLKVNGCLGATCWHLPPGFLIQLKIKPFILTVSFPSLFSRLPSLPTQTIEPTKLAAPRILPQAFLPL